MGQVILESMPRVDWDFAGQGTGKHITGLHPYPARFIPAIPKAAIRAYLDSPGCVLDPFAGCGSTLVEAAYAGHSAVGIDVNGVAHLLQRVYGTRYTKTQLEAVRRLAVSEPALPTLEAALDTVREIPRIEHWFGPNAIRALAWAMGKVRSLKGPPSDLAALAVSRVIVTLSKQESDTQYRATTPDLPVGEAVTLVRRSMLETVDRVASHVVALRGKVTARLGDSRDDASFAGLGTADLVVTSPPYPNAYEYWLYHKYRMFWMDMDPIWSRTHEIGARPYFSGSGKLGPLDFQRDMATVFANVDQVCTPDARQVWVVGNSVIKGELVDNAQLISDVAEDHDWMVSREERKVSRHRSSFQGIGRQKQESVLVMVRRA